MSANSQKRTFGCGLPDAVCSAIIRLGLLDDPLKKAADTVGNIIIGAKSAEVTPIRGKDGAA